ncbi:hypothetical protein B0H34DRAFT_859431 [Crassisporium funariophilum]|nr:hypothetical protein B0H34DRAFT_859431 [Crassisporium funariophilum]
MSDPARKLPQRQPCYCTRCQGASVSRKTFLKHKKLYPVLNQPPAAIPSYIDWLSSGAGSSFWVAGDVEMATGDENDMEGPDKECTEDEGDTDEDKDKRPSKKVCARQPEPNNFSQPDSPPVYGFEQEVDYDDIYEVDDKNAGEIDRHKPEEANHPDPAALYIQPDELDPRDNDLAPEIPIVDPDELRELRNNELEELARLQTAAAEHAELPPEDHLPQEHAEPASIHSRIGHVKLTQQFIEEIKNATLDNGKLDRDALDRLRSPDQHPVDISDPDTRLSLDLFMDCDNASGNTYSKVRKSLVRRFPDLSDSLLSYDGVKTLVAKISGVVSVSDDMCINSCHAFTGPFAELEACHYCLEPRYNPVVFEKTGKKVHRKEACTFPIGPQAQALRRSEKGSRASLYRQLKTDEILAVRKQIEDGEDIKFVYDNIFCGEDFLDLAGDLKLSSDDLTVIFSFDGAQLYQNKKSDTWIGVWVIAEYDPTTRYKKIHVLPAVTIPGPHKPKNLICFNPSTICRAANEKTTMPASSSGTIS